jgi:hypothetical protein
MYHLWVAGWNTWIFILLVSFLRYSLRCYHEHDSYGLAFFDMTSTTSVDIHTLEKKKEFTRLLSRLALSISVYFIWHKRNNKVFHQIYRSHQDVCDDIFYLFWSRLVELELRFHIPATFRSIWCLWKSWDTIVLVVFEIVFSTISYVINRSIG